ncbi:MAG: hypothetical protein ACYSWP_02150 [Planctomycetota bacterium]|jgi:ribosomal protein RSM22 (predicted rRNA methylase)
MDNELHNLVKENFCPNGIWRLSNVMKSVLKLQMSQLPSKKVSENETRYPETPEGMRAFLLKFFTRHYFQVQNSILDYLVSESFLEKINSGEIRILDIGSGPALASLAIAEIVHFIVGHLKRTGQWPSGKPIKISFVLNDTSSICLGAGQEMLTNYFRLMNVRRQTSSNFRMSAISKAYPENFQQIERIKRNIGPFDVVVLSYVILPLKESEGIKGLVDGLLSVEKVCLPQGKILVLQDRFNSDLIRRIGRALGRTSHKKNLTQEIYPERNSSNSQTYEYYYCLYAPTTEKVGGQCA